MTNDAGVLPPLDNATKLAFDRTWLAEERTMLAWVRTATSLITFGFAIYSFFGTPAGAGHALAKTKNPQIFSLGLIVIGLVTLLGALIQRRQAIRAITLKYPKQMRFSLAEAIAALIGCLGIFALISFMLRF